jgi:hypothetical protein
MWYVCCMYVRSSLILIFWSMYASRYVCMHEGMHVSGASVCAWSNYASAYPSMFCMLVLYRYACTCYVCMCGMYLGRLLVLWRSGVRCGDAGALLRRSNHLVLPPDPSTAGRMLLDVGVVDAYTHPSHPHISAFLHSSITPTISACLHPSITPTHIYYAHNHTYEHVAHEHSSIRPPSSTEHLHIHTQTRHHTYTLVSITTHMY